MGELEKILKLLKVLQPHRKNNNVNHTELQGTKSPTKEYMELPMVPAAFEAEGGLI